jgi:hypothetical protein
LVLQLFWMGIEILWNGRSFQMRTCGWSTFSAHRKVFRGSFGAISPSQAISIRFRRIGWFPCFVPRTVFPSQFPFLLIRERSRKSQREMNPRSRLDSGEKWSLTSEGLNTKGTVGGDDEQTTEVVCSRDSAGEWGNTSWDWRMRTVWSHWSQRKLGINVDYEMLGKLGTPLHNFRRFFPVNCPPDSRQ